MEPVSDPDDRYIEVMPADQDRLRSHIAERMASLGVHTQAQLVERSGASAPTVRAMMRGTPGRYWRSKLRQVADGLDWTSDSIERILLHLHPEPTPAGALSDGEVARLSREFRNVLDPQAA